MKTRFFTAIPIAIFALYICGCSSEPKEQKAKEVKVADLGLKSDAFAQGDTIPVKYTCDGDDISPALTWNKPPDGTKEMVLICDDPDAPRGTWDHWVVYGIPPDTLGIPEDVQEGEVVDGVGTQGINSGRKNGYNGPCPPKGPVHRYFFKLYALDKNLDLKPGKVKAEVEKAMEGHILAKGELMGRYGR